MKKKHAASIVAALSLLAGCLDMDGQAASAYKRCTQFKPGVSLAELRSTFGEEDRDPSDQWPASWYVFHPAAKDYELLYSGPVIAKTSPSGTIVSLQCSEFNYAFRGA